MLAVWFEISCASNEAAHVVQQYRALDMQNLGCTSPLTVIPEQVSLVSKQDTVSRYQLA